MAGLRQRTLIDLRVAFAQFGRQPAGQIGVLVPFLLDAVHQGLHATEFPAGAVLAFGKKAEQPAVEHDATEIWRAQLAIARQILRENAVAAGEVAAIGIANQRETTLLWDRKSGEPVAPAIV